MFIAIRNLKIIISAFGFNSKMNRQILSPRTIKKGSIDSE